MLVSVWMIRPELSVVTLKLTEAASSVSSSKAAAPEDCGLEILR
jgi:hypothetical protein